jgi:hypothetical protein
MTKDEALALDLALEALEPFSTPNWAGAGVDKVNAAITAIRQVRSAPVQEPAKRVCSLGCKNLGACCADPMCEAVAAIPPAQPAVQEPVGYTDGDGRAWAVKWSGHCLQT